MKSIIIGIILLLSASSFFAQNSIKIIIKNNRSKEPLIGATVQLKGSSIGASADETGNIELNNIPNGQQTLLFSFVGYKPTEKILIFPAAQPDAVLTVFLEDTGEELDQITVSTTRTSRNINNVPTRIEVISLEEIDEKANMKPTNVAMLLNESIGIQMQQTSYTSATQSIRIQGLDGRYTQILKDGFPVFGGFSSGLSVLQIPPLDLRQVEIIKGSASTLYGGGAIAGVINFVSKEPSEKRDISLILNENSTLESNVGVWVSQRNKKIGFTMLGAFNYQHPYDVDKDDFTELPKTTSLSFNPRLFFYFNDSTQLVIGNAFNYETRFGGDIFVINNKPDNYHAYFEKNNSFRNITTAEFTKKIEAGELKIKQAFNYFDRSISVPNYFFQGTQVNSFTDASYLHKTDKHTLIFGANVLYDSFKEAADSSKIKRDYNQFTTGLYVQDNWDINEKLLLEGGFRLDYVLDYGVFALPRLSLLYKISDKISTRLGGGLGYKTPTIFSEQTESLAFKNVIPLSANILPEHSYGGSFDVNYKTALSDVVFLSINQLFFLTQINQPLVLLQDAGSTDYFQNATLPVRSYGFETNARLVIDNWIKLFAAYSYTEVKAEYISGDNKDIPLVPKQRFLFNLVFEKEHNFKWAFEGYYSDKQRLTNGNYSPTFWELGMAAEKTFNNIVFFVNVENFLDVRQNRFGQVVFPPHNNPTFAEIYTHTEGRVFNGGIKIKF